MSVYTDLTAAKDYLIGKVGPWANDVACALPPGLVIPTLLSGIYLKLAELVELSQSAGIMDIQPLTVTGGSPSVMMLDVDPAGRSREVTVWIDLATGGPMPTIRISKDASGSGGGGIRVTPGQVNELGKIPGNIKLYIGADADTQLYVMTKS